MESSAEPVPHRQSAAERYRPPGFGTDRRLVADDGLPTDPDRDDLELKTAFYLKPGKQKYFNLAGKPKPCSVLLISKILQGNCCSVKESGTGKR